MDVTDIIDPLNDAQREAVSTGDIPTLVLAGAGSGKTRVLVHRVAWLVRVEGLAPQHVLAVNNQCVAGIVPPGIPHHHLYSLRE